MSIFMISYDLHSPTNNREKVENAIKSLGTWCKYVSTTFLVKTDSDSSTVQDVATKHLDSNDAMIICKIEKPILGWLSQAQWNWIHENM
jgi:hypothetical protein